MSTSCISVHKIFIHKFGIVMIKVTYTTVADDVINILDCSPQFCV